MKRSRRFEGEVVEQQASVEEPVGAPPSAPPEPTTLPAPADGATLGKLESALVAAFTDDRVHRVLARGVAMELALRAVRTAFGVAS